MKRIPLTQGQFALIDDADFERFGGIKWFARWSPPMASFYAIRNTVGYPRRSISLHRAVLNITDAHIHVDHRNHDTLDNRRENLRACTPAKNQANRKGKNKNNTSGFRGVRLHSSGKWEARIGFNNRLINLGHFSTPELASRAYASANKKFFGEFGGGV